MVTWVDYTGSKEQLEKLASAKTMVRVRYANGREANWACVVFKQRSGIIYPLQNAIAYLISEPHPYADLIKIWADTGCPVYWKSKTGGGYGICHENFPPFAHPNEFEYQLTPFED